MKINETQRIGAINQYRRSGNGTGQDMNMRAKRRDQVEISAEAKELHELQGVTNPEKIERLKQSVASGTYYVEARQIAEKLLPFIK